MQKDFDGWNKIKKQLESSSRNDNVYFNEREIWWCALGVNVGSEQNGAGPKWQRPVIILKKVSVGTCLVVPLTTANPTKKYYLHIGTIAHKEAFALISQIRLVDRKRLINKMSFLDKNQFYDLVDRIVEENFPSSLKKVLPRSSERGRGRSRGSYTFASAHVEARPKP